MLLFRQKSLDLRIEITGYLDGVRDAVLKYALCHLFHLSLTQKSDISGINRTQNQMFHITVHASNSTGWSFRKENDNNNTQNKSESKVKLVNTASVRSKTDVQTNGSKLRPNTTY